MAQRCLTLKNTVNQNQVSDRGSLADIRQIRTLRKLHLQENASHYLQNKGLPTILNDVKDLINKRLAPVAISWEAH